MDFSTVDYNDPASMFAALGGGPGSGLPIPESISPEKVRSQALGRSRQIFADRELLNAILERHEPTIHKRWLKKTKTQRTEILLRAWPKMAASHRPDFAAWQHESDAQRQSKGTRFREAFMWPYINLQDLAKTKTLLMFLQARARNEPDVFAMADENAAHLGYVSQALVPVFLNEYTMMFTNRKTVDTYGELISWDDEDEAFMWLQSGKGLHPGQGLIVLEIQQRMYRFLVDCCRGILHDIPEDALLGNNYPLQPTVVLKTETVNGFASLAAMAAEAPYRVPASLDLTRLESLLEARATMARDHIWSLREDPSYFAEMLSEGKEHRQEMLKDRNGHDHPLFTLHREEILWERILGNLIGNAYVELEVYAELHRQVKEVDELRTKYADDITIDKDLPDEHLNALLKFQYYLDEGTKGPFGQLKHMFVASPPVRANFMREPPPNATTPMIGILQRPRMKNLHKAQIELIWLLKTLWDDDYELFLAGKTTAVDELERLIQTEAKAKEMISAQISAVIGDLSICTEGLRQIKIYQPWSATFEESLVDKKDGIAKAFAQHAKQWSMFLGGATSGPSGAKVVRLGDPKDRKFYYPADKRRWKENVELMRVAEQNLDAFWAAVDENITSKTKHGLDGTALQRLLAQPRALQRTPDWEPEKAVTTNSVPSNSVPTITVENLERPMSELYFDLEHRTERTIDRGQRNQRASTKTKTRGKPAPATSGRTGIAHNDAADPQPTFHIDARALKVFRTLFYTPSIDATPGVVPWIDFLHAMVSTGFVPEKLYGSIWQFQPTKLDVERSIQFHEPHPGGKLPYLIARRFGRRLERAYGWHGEMFELKEKAQS